MTFTINISVPTNGSAAGYLSATLPIAAGSGYGTIAAARNSTSGALDVGIINPGSTTVVIQNASGGYPVTDGQGVTVSGSYQIASP